MTSRKGDDPRELLAAFRDGISELAPDDRRGVEAALAGDDQLRVEHARIGAMLDRLRALPPEGAEPDWGALERSIRDAVGGEVPRPWWRRWTVLAPVTTLVTAMAVLTLVLWTHGMPSPTQPTPPVPTNPALTAPRHPALADEPAPALAEAHDNVVPLWLDGAELDLDMSSAEAADLLAQPDDPSDSVADADAADSNDTLLPASDLAWIDRLDGDDLARAERWLASRKKG